MDFCVDDGTPLEYFTPFASANVPTKVLTPFSAQPSTRNNSSKIIYAALGAMGAIIIGLGAVLLYVSSVSRADTNTNENSPAAKPDSAALTQPKNSNSTAIAAMPPISAEAADELIRRWENAQDSRDFAAYRACYSPTFAGVKRTPASPGGREMKFDAWMRDRRATMARIADVQLDGISTRIDGEVAIVTFVQKWRSKNHCDIGDKEILIRMFADGPKIVSEDIRNPTFCR